MNRPVRPTCPSLRRTPSIVGAPRLSPEATGARQQLAARLRAACFVPPVFLLVERHLAPLAAMAAGSGAAAPAFRCA